jgi:hypothetical protein
MSGGVTKVSCSCPVMLLYISGVTPSCSAPTTVVITGAITVAIIIPVTN